MATVLQKKNGQYLWFALLGLGFQADITTSSFAGKANVTVKHINVGPNMFDKPNKDAFYIVTHFLLEKLNPTRFHEAYRHCWPVLNHKADAEFRKITCAWLREIMDEAVNAGSKVVASLFLSPGGPKFTSLMLHLTNHVMLQEMKTFTTDDSWIPEDAATPASTLDMAVKRFSLIRTRFLKTAVDQDRFLHEYQRRAQLLVKSMRDIRADGAKYDELLKRHSSDSTQEGDSPAEKIKKVQLLWSTIDGMLSTIKEDKNAVESVLKGDADQYILDGMDGVLRIPRCLLERIEKLPHQLSSGNVYEGGQLNLLCVMELMNYASQLLKEERFQVSHAPKAQVSPQQLQQKCHQMARMLQDLHLIRQKISKEEIPEVRNAIRELEADWEKKWMETVKETPLVSFLNEDPALGFLSPMAPLCFEPAAEASYRSSIFSQYPAKLLEEKPAEGKSQEGVHPSCSVRSSFLATAERPGSPVATMEAPRANTSLDWLFDTPPSPPVRAPPVQPPQFADAIATTSPSEDSVKGSELEGLLSSLQRDPFSTRKQLPRTPESLILDVKSSWRKAVEEDNAKKIQQSADFDGSIMRRLSPLPEPCSLLLSPDAASHNVSCSVTPAVMLHGGPHADRQGALLKSSFSWDTFNAEPLDSLSGSSSVQFSLQHETLPEMPSCDSLLSLDDETVDMRSEDEELLIPLLKIESTQSPLTTRHRQASLMEKTPECLVSDYKGSDRDWLMEPATTQPTDKVFSLDLDALETHSPPKKQEYSLPKLITFSPIDDMKC
ncbi:HAUS augmin-like complex subunit 6 isoform X2 [Amphiprion ocellaris]|uniref:HAUS augmin-like complex subunit 6 isoform X2 n=1 Tax=Amphiprion ocellaris TaxID=80972 RepID=UPI002410C7A4|nr:HAUS augmin-like complex subunit 6 isoform X2 [Amphiprion ocellaris]